MADHLTFVEQVLHYFDRPHTGVPTASIAGPAAWLGCDLETSPEWEHRLTDDEAAELDAAVAGVAPDRPLTELSAEAFPLPTLSAVIREWRSELDTGRGFVLVRGLPVERWSEHEREVAFWGLGRHLGIPGEQSGRHDLLGHVTDLGDPADADGRQYRTNQDIRFHCDAADVVGLLCLRPAADGGTSRLVSSVSVFNLMLAEHPDLVARLFEPFMLDARQEDGADGSPYLPVQPCCFDGSRLRTFMHVGYFGSVTRHGVELSDRDRATLEAWEAIAERPGVHLGMDFGPGDLQWVSNHSVTHARTAYVDHDDPTRRRHLLRLWLSLL